MTIRGYYRCSKCGQEHEKILRIRRNGRIYCPKPRNKLLQLGQPRCVQYIQNVINGIHIEHSRDKVRLYYLLWWIEDLFEGECHPEIHIESEEDWQWYRSIVKNIFQMLRRFSFPSYAKCHKIIKNMFPSSIRCPVSVIEPIAKDFWLFADMGYPNTRWLEDCPLHPESITFTNDEFKYLDLIAQLQPEAFAEFIAEEMVVVSQSGKIWCHISPKSVYFAQKIAEKGCFSAMERIREKLNDPHLQTSQPEFQAFRAAILRAFEELPKLTHNQ